MIVAAVVVLTALLLVVASLAIITNTDFLQRIENPRAFFKLLRRDRHRRSNRNKAVKLTVSLSQRAQECPMCSTPIDSDVKYCSGCKTLYHYECLEEMGDGVCPTLGCNLPTGTKQKHRA